MKPDLGIMPPEPSLLLYRAMRALFLIYPIQASNMAGLLCRTTNNGIKANIIKKYPEKTVSIIRFNLIHEYTISRHELHWNDSIHDWITLLK